MLPYTSACMSVKACVTMLCACYECPVILQQTPVSWLLNFVQGRSPLHIACNSDAAQVVSFLLSQGSHVNAADNQVWWSNLLTASSMCHVSRYALYPDVPCIQMCLLQGFTPLHHATDVAVVKSLWSTGAAVNAVDKQVRPHMLLPTLPISKLYRHY